MLKNKYFHVLNINSEFNSGVLPIYINDNEIIDNHFIRFDDYKYLRSQYSLEIVLHNMFKQHHSVNNYFFKSER